MNATVVSQSSSKELRKLFATITSTIGETIGSLIGRELAVKPETIELTTAEALLGVIARPHAVVRGALDKDYAGKTLSTLFEIQDAISMSGLLMMTPEDVIEERRARGVLESEDVEAFGELGNVLCSGFGNVLRDAVPNLDYRLQDHGVIKPGLDPQSMLPDGALVAFSFKMKIGSSAETTGRIVVDRGTAEAWNKAPLAVGGDAGAATAVVAPAKASEGGAKDEDSLDDIPAAPVRGVLNTYLTTTEPIRVLRRSARRVGLELRRHARGAIPNPAAHRNEIVVVEIPAGEEKRFDWCRRIKEYAASTKVLILLHMPSRQRVTAAFKVQADAIVGLPVEETQLSAKLTALLAT